MGKLSTVTIILLMINIIGTLLVTAQNDMGYQVENPFIGTDTILGRLYSSQTYTDANGVEQRTYVISGTSSPYTDASNGLPTSTPTSLLQQGVTFIDRIFVIFAPLRLLVGILVFPVAVLGYLGLYMPIALLFLAPLTLLYFFGFIDLISGGNN